MKSGPPAANIGDPNHLRYWLTLHLSSSATCTCFDWLRNGGACKHLRAFKQLISQNRSTVDREVDIPPRNSFYFPTSPLEEEEILHRNKAWYGVHFEELVTPFANALAVGHLAAVQVEGSACRGYY